MTSKDTLGGWGELEEEEREYRNIETNRWRKWCRNDGGSRWGARAENHKALSDLCSPPDEDVSYSHYTITGVGQNTDFNPSPYISYNVSCFNHFFFTWIVNTLILDFVLLSGTKCEHKHTKTAKACVTHTHTHTISSSPTVKCSLFLCNTLF